MKCITRFVLGLAFALLLPLQAFGAWSATLSTDGFEIDNAAAMQPRLLYIDGVASQAYVKGAPLILNTYLVDAAAAASANLIGVSAEAKTLPAATDASDDRKLALYMADSSTIWRAMWATPLDDAALSAISAGGTDIAFGAALTYGNAAVDNSIRGHTVHIYKGPGTGEWRYITAYDAAGGATGNQMITVDRPFSITPTTSSYFIILGTGTDGQGVYPGGHIDIGTSPKLAGNDIAGAYTVVDIDQAWQGIIKVRITDTVFQAP